MGYSSGVEFEFAENSKHFIAVNYSGCRIYVPRSQSTKPYNRYFWSRDDSSQYYVGELLHPKSICCGVFFKHLNDEEKNEFINIILPELEKRYRRS